MTMDETIAPFSVGYSDFEWCETMDMIRLTRIFIFLKMENMETALNISTSYLYLFTVY
jgi:hypothetical protein